MFLPSHNKGARRRPARHLSGSGHPRELLDDGDSTDTKTRKLLNKFVRLDDPRIRDHELHLNDEIRNNHAIAPWLLNQYYPSATGDVIMYLSDDDLFVSGLFRGGSGLF